jgi:hypothetical protein
MTEIWYCPFSRLYFGRPPCNPMLLMHTDVLVSDMLTLDDLKDHELGYDLAMERYELYARAGLVAEYAKPREVA